MNRHSPLRPFGDDYATLVEAIAGRSIEPPADGTPRRPKFIIEPFETIKFEATEEWLVKGVVPRQGVGAIFGESQAFKSFVALNLAFHIALGWRWAERRVIQGPVIYVAAEGARGVRKRKVGFERANEGRLQGHVPFSLISAAPNLGTGRDDLGELIASIEGAGVAPQLIVIDTLAQSLGGGEENGAGMVTFVANATALANRFGCFVLIVHHVGLNEKDRLRGHSSLIGGLDVSILAERRKDELSSTLTLQKLKDDESGVKLTARMSRIVIGQNEDGDDVSTLLAEVSDGAEDPAKASKSVPRSQRLLMDVVAAALDEAGKDFHPFSDGPLVRGAPDDAIRTRYYARVAEKAEPGEDKDKLAARQCKAFNRAIKSAIDAKTVCAGEREGDRYIWLP